MSRKKWGIIGFAAAIIVVSVGIVFFGVRQADTEDYPVFAEAPTLPKPPSEPEEMPTPKPTADELIQETLMLLALSSTRFCRDDMLETLSALSLEELQALEGLPPHTLWERFIPPPEPVIHTARLAFVGDVMCHAEQLTAARVSEGVYDFHYKFRHIAPYIRSADFAIANLETTLVHPHEFRFAGWPLFRSPRSLAEALLYAGFDYVTTGNNHSFDAFAAGVRSTQEILTDVGLGFTGTYLTPACRDNITVVEVNGFTFALINMTMHVNSLESHMYNHMYMVKIVYHDLVEQATIDYDLIRDSIARAQALDPDFIIMLPHIGIEYYGTMDRQGAGHRRDFFDETDSRWVNWMRTFHFMLDAGADIVMNHHPHTLLPAEFVYITNDDGMRRGFIAHSMANFVSAQRTQPREAGAVFYLDFERVDDGPARLVGAAYTPIWVRQHDPTRQGMDFTVLPVTETLRRVKTGDHADLHTQDIERLREVHRDVTHMLSGAPIPLEDMADEYPITRYRAREAFPGLPLWGTLPWR